MRIPQHKRDNDFGAMTSMIDVVFLLLIFFVVSASGQIREMLLPTELAAGAVETEVAVPEPEPLTVEVWLKLTRDGDRTLVDMNGTIYEELPKLKDQLRTLAEVGPENPIILDVAADVPLEDLVDIYDTCQGAGFESVNFAAG